LGNEGISIDEIPNALDEILQSSLWQRGLNRRENELQILFNSVLAQRGKHIWDVTTTHQRKGYFLAGVGLETGQRLDAISQQANVLLINANAYIAMNDQPSAIASITNLAELLFDIPPFIPRTLPNDWKDILAAWLSGEALTEGAAINIDDALKFIEDGLIYRLPWGMEAIRVRAQANEDVIVDGVTIGDYELDLVVPAIENGTLNKSAALLMQAGFSSRKAAIHAVSSTNASFTNGQQFKVWLMSKDVRQRTLSLAWPTPEASTLWRAFLEEYQPRSETTWSDVSVQLPVDWLPDHKPLVGTMIKLWNGDVGNTQALNSSGELIGHLDCRYCLLDAGTYSSRVNEVVNHLDVTYWGPGKEPFKSTHS